MNREEEFELRLAEWLEDGPFAAPDRVLIAAIEHARTHPRRRSLRIAFWRSAMSDIHTVPVAPRRALHIGRRLTSGLAGVAVLAIVVASGAFVIINRGSGPASPRASVAVTGTTTIRDVLDPGSSVTTDAGISQLRGLKRTASWTSSDPRTAGTLSMLESEDTNTKYSYEVNPRYGVVPTKTWGTATLTGPQGTWTGSYAGLIEGAWTGSRTRRMAAVLLGTGAYKGLQYRVWMTSDEGTTYHSSGVIEPVPSLEAKPGAGPQVIGTDTCEKMRLGPESTQTADSVGIRTRNASAACRVQTNDPRVNGTSTRVINDDPAGSFTVTWGTSEIVNAGGSWTGVFVIGRDEMDVMSFAYVGSGGYAGLRFEGGGSYSTTDTYILDAAVDSAP